MAFSPSAAHQRPRWLALLLVLTTMLVVATSLVSAHGVSTIPTRYDGGSEVDSDPPPAPAINDEPGQVDMTRMGRDTSVNPDVRVFWSWDAISAWTGKGQTGDACALFDDADADANIDYVVCARVSNTNADPALTELLPASTDHPAYLFDCSNAKNDRCTQPTPRAYNAGQVLAGPLAASVSLTTSGAGNLQNETDPFPAGEAYPHDTSIEIQVASSLVPTGVQLANVCSYPSAGNGGNNNPFDCVVTPGVQYGELVINKVVVNDNGGTATAANFSYTVNGGSATAFEADGSNSHTLPVGNYSVLEVGVPISGYTTSYANGSNANLNCTNLAVTAGGTTTCTITNDDQKASPTGTTAQNWTLNDSATLSGLAAGGSAGSTTLNGAVAAGATSIVVTSATGFPTASEYLITIGTEKMLVTGGFGTTTWTVVRGYAGTTDAAHASGDTVTGSATVMFKLYFNAASSSCAAAPVFTQAVVAGGSVSTTGGYTTSTAGYYSWRIWYSGDSNNNAFDKACGTEITQVIKTE